MKYLIWVCLSRWAAEQVAALHSPLKRVLQLKDEVLVMVQVLDRLAAAFQTWLNPPGFDKADYALKEVQYYNANFDALDQKAGGIVQFIAIVLGLSAFQAQNGQHLTLLREVSLGIFATALLLALLAWWVRGGSGMVSVLEVERRINEIGDEDACKEIVQCLAQCSTSSRKHCLKKFKILRATFVVLLVGVVCLLVSVYTGY